jgi:hypothetical protein
MQLIHRNRNKTNRKPPEGIISRFIVSAFFGCLMSFVILLFILRLTYGIHQNGLVTYLRFNILRVLWILSLFWGIFGIFFYDKLLSIASKIIEGFLDSVSRRYK